MKRKQKALKVPQLQTHPEMGVSDQQIHLRETLLAVDAEIEELIKDKRNNKDQDYLKQVGF